MIKRERENKAGERKRKESRGIKRSKEEAKV